VDVEVATLEVKSGFRLPQDTLVTEPPPPPLAVEAIVRVDPVWVRVMLLPAVSPEFKSVPWTSLKVGAALAPETGPIQKVEQAWVTKVPVRLPEVVIGLPETVMILGSESPTEVTVPLVFELPAAAMVIVFPVSVRVILLPWVKELKISCPWMAL
jgi:hypothetical protein